MNSSRPVTVRFPPSPTGYCHVGTARMAILNYLYAKKHGGKIVFRSEDTDKERSRREYEEDIIEQLKWLGLSWDDFSRTTELVEQHKEAMQQLVEEGKAFISEEASKKDPNGISKVVRLRNPGKPITFDDVIRGEITFDTTELGDFVIGRAVDDPLYHFAVVVDDASQGITHVIRGEDHISNTPRQILIQEALGYERPVYAHYPLHLGSDRSKLSKRTGDVAVRSYREKGYLPDALLNYIAILGWTPPSGREVLTKEEMINEFELTDIHKSGAVFDLEKLRWYNREYLQALPAPILGRYVCEPLSAAITARGLQWSQVIGEAIVEIVYERIHVAEDIKSLVDAGELDYFFAEPTLALSRIPEKKSNPTDAVKHLMHTRGVFTAISEQTWEEDSVKKALWDYATAEGRGAVLWPLRYALSGRDKSPDPFAIAGILGKEATLCRIDAALQLLRSV